eukprot:m51a1_g7677 hypothetical protein (244) ;mRNA; f:14-745
MRSAAQLLASTSAAAGRASAALWALSLLATLAAGTGGAAPSALSAPSAASSLSPLPAAGHVAAAFLLACHELGLHSVLLPALLASLRPARGSGAPLARRLCALCVAASLLASAALVALVVASPARSEAAEARGTLGSLGAAGAAAVASVALLQVCSLAVPVAAAQSAGPLGPSSLRWRARALCALAGVALLCAVDAWGFVACGCAFVWLSAGDAAQLSREFALVPCDQLADPEAPPASSDTRQ